MQVTTADDIKTLGTILGIWAHPDDEVFTMGGILAAAVRNGQTVVCITATKGEAGVQDEARWPARKLGRIREKELMEAYKILGIKNHHWLDFPDGGCNEADEGQAVQRLVSLIHTYKPDSIFTFGPDGMTGHPDHVAVSHWTDIAHGKSGSQAVVYHAIQTDEQYEGMKEADQVYDIFFNAPQPVTCDETECAVCFCIDESLYDLKYRALLAMPSQTEALLGQFGDALKPSLEKEAFVRAG